MSDNKNFVSGLRCIRMDYARSDDGERWELIEVPGSEFIIEADTVILAVGHQPNSSAIDRVSGFKYHADGTIKIDEETMMTSVQSVFAAGNIVTNAGPFVEAFASGKKAAVSIGQYLMDKK